MLFKIRLFFLKLMVNSYWFRDVFQFILMHCLIAKDVDRTNLLIECGINPNQKCKYKAAYGNYYLEQTPLALSVQGCLLPVVRQLLKHQADVNSIDQEQRTPLFYAAMSGDKIMLETLIQAGANVNHQDFEKETALTVAAKHGHVGCVKALIESSANVNHFSQKRTALEWAIAEGNLDVVDFLTAWQEQQFISGLIANNSEAQELPILCF